MDYDYCDLTVLPFRIAHNTPLLPNIPSFATSADALGLHPTTASILDDMRFLINAVMSLPDNASPGELQKVSTTASWIYERIKNLPEDSPETKKRFDYVEIAFQTGLVEPQQASPTGNSFEDDRANTRADADSSSSRNNQEPPPPPQPQPQAQRVDPTKPNAQEPGPAADSPGPDYMYRVIRLAALVNIRAIRDRVPLSKACSMDEFLQVWTTSWRVPLTTWRCSVGIFNWAMLAIIPACHGGAHERFARTMYMISMISRSAEDWRLTFEASRVAMRLQRWLAKGGREGAPRAGGQAVAQHGFLNTNWESA